MIDLHTHTIFSDGELIPSELVRRAEVKGYTAIGLTDHVDFTNIEHVLSSLSKAKYLEDVLDMKIFAGVELTHVPPEKIESLTTLARRLGAEIVVVHGETPVEPVRPGTNLAAIKAGVDILAHPGFLTAEEAELARDNNVCLEITSRLRAQHNQRPCGPTGERGWSENGSRYRYSQPGGPHRHRTRYPDRYRRRPDPGRGQEDCDRSSDS